MDGHHSIRACAIYNNQDGVRLSQFRFGCALLNNVIWDNTRDGVRVETLASVGNGFPGWTFEHNIIGNNDGYNLRSVAGDLSGSAMDIWCLTSQLANAYYTPGTSLDNLSQMPSEGGDAITLTVDPFLDSANRDFRLNTTSGGRQAIRDANRTITFLDNGSNVHHPTTGLIQW